MNGKIIKERIDAGHTFTVYMGPNRKYTKYVMEFWLMNPNGENFVTATKFQAMKYLNEIQRDAVEAFEKVYDVMVNSARSKPFGRHLDDVRELDKLAESKPMIKIVKEARKEMITFKFKGK